MKKGLLYLLVALAGFSSCRKEDAHVFDQSPDERINEALAQYQSELVDAPYGWRAIVFPSGAQGGVFSFYFRFNDSNRVVMFSDFDSLSSVTPMESSYRLKALQQPSLLFDTYSYLHRLSDPDASNNGGAYGLGLASDFEFAIEGLSGDTMKLRGRFHNTEAMLVKATQEEANDFYNKKFGQRLLDNIGRFVTYFKRLEVNGKQYDINVNKYLHTITLSWVDDDGNIKTETTGYYYTTDGIALYPAIKDGATVIDGFDGIDWDEVNGILSFEVNGADALIEGSGQPLKVDKDAPRRWWQTAVDEDRYWVSVNGFHVNGVDDAYHITETPDYFFMVYWPQFGSSGGVTYDLNGYVKYNGGAPTIGYGTAYRPPNFTSDGRAIFTWYGTLGTVPASDSVAVADTRVQFTDAAGYYFVQTGTNTYDMVSAKDGKAWITWEW